MTLRVVPAPPVDPLEEHDDPLVRGLARVNRNLKGAFEESKREAAKLADGVREWRESWEDMLESISSLKRDVQERAKGRRFATVLDLDNLLVRAEARGSTEGPTEGTT